MTKTKVKSTKEKLIEAFNAAEVAAEQFASIDDGGTCNLDSAAFHLKGVREATVQAAAAATNCTVYKFSWFGRTYYWLTTPKLNNGQGERRAKQARAATEALRAFEEIIPGFKASTYCAMD